MPVAYGINTITKNGITVPIDIRYTDQGPRDGPVIVFINGLGSQLVHLQYNTLVGPLIDKGYRVIRLDNRDAGNSTILDAFEDDSVAKSIVSALFNPASAKKSPLHYDPLVSFEEQVGKELLTPGNLPESILKLEKNGEIKGGEHNDIVGNDGNLQLGPDYNIYPGFTPRELIYEHILNQRKLLLENFNKKQQQQQQQKRLNPQNPPPTHSSDETATPIAPSESPTPETPPQLPQLPQIPQHDLFDHLTATHRAPIANLFETFYYAVESSLISRSTTDSIYCISAIAVDIILLINFLQIDKFSILGTSMGGMIATWLAALVPNRILSFTCIMSSTGNSQYHPKLFFLLRNAFGRKRPPTPPYPVLKKRNEVEIGVERDGGHGGDGIIETNDRDKDLKNGMNDGQSDSVQSLTLKTAPSGDGDKNTKQIDDKNNLPQYQEKLKKYNFDRKNFQKYVEFLVEVNESVGAAPIHPHTGQPKLYNNGRTPFEHYSSWVRRSPAAKGYTRQAAAITTGPCRDTLLFFISQYIPILFVHGEDDELMRVENTQHSFDICKAGLDYVAPVQIHEKIEQKQIKIGIDKIRKEGVEIKHNDQNNDQNKLEKATSSDHIITTATTITLTTSKMTPVEAVYDTEDGCARVTRILGFNKNSKKLLQHRKVIIKGCKHEIIDAFSNYLVPQLFLHLDDAIRNQINSQNYQNYQNSEHKLGHSEHSEHSQNSDKKQETENSASPDHVPLPNSSPFPPLTLPQTETQPEFTYHDEDLLFGLEDEAEDMDYYNPNADPPSPPKGHILIQKKGQFLVIPETKTNTDVPSPVNTEQHPEYAMSPVASPGSAVSPNGMGTQNGQYGQNNLQNGQSINISHSFSVVEEPSHMETYSTAGDKNKKNNGNNGNKKNEQNIGKNEPNELHAEKNSTNDDPRTNPHNNNHENDDGVAGDENIGFFSKIKNKFSFLKRSKPIETTPPETTTTTTTTETMTTNETIPSNNDRLVRDDKDGRTSQKPQLQPQKSISSRRNSNQLHQSFSINLSNNQRNSWNSQHGLGNNELENLEGVQQPQYGMEEI